MFFIIFLASVFAEDPVYPKGIVQKFPHEELTKMGFSKHYNRTFSEYWIINHIKPPKGKKLAFFGCRGINDTNIKIGMFGESDFFFKQHGKYKSFIGFVFKKFGFHQKFIFRYSSFCKKLLLRFSV